MTLFGNIIFQYCVSTIFDTLGQIINDFCVKISVSPQTGHIFWQPKKGVLPQCVQQRREEDQ